MNRTNLTMATVGFVVVVLASLVPPVGMYLLAPLAAMAAGACAARRAVARTGESQPWAGVKAGAAVGAGALLGTVAAILAVVVILGGDQSVQESLRDLALGASAWLPSGWVAPLASTIGVLATLALGAVNLAAALFGSLIVASRPVPVGAQRDGSEPDYGVYMAVGMCLGIAFGVAFGNLALGAALGLGAGTAVYLVDHYRRRRAL